MSGEGREGQKLRRKHEHARKAVMDEVGGVLEVAGRPVSLDSRASGPTGRAR